MKSIDQIKHNGMVKELSNEIDKLLFELIQNNWNDIKQNSKYSFKLKISITNARKILDQMENIFEELKKLDP